MAHAALRRRNRNRKAPDLGAFRLRKGLEKALSGTDGRCGSVSLVLEGVVRWKSGSSSKPLTKGYVRSVLEKEVKKERRERLEALEPMSQLLAQRREGEAAKNLEAFGAFIVNLWEAALQHQDRDAVEVEVCNLDKSLDKRFWPSAGVLVLPEAGQICEPLYGQGRPLSCIRPMSPCLEALLYIYIIKVLSVL